MRGKKIGVNVWPTGQANDGRPLQRQAYSLQKSCCRMIRVARAAARVAISSALGAHRRACRFRALLARADRRHYGADKSFIHRNKVGGRVRPDNVVRQRVGNRRSRAIVCHCSLVGVFLEIGKRSQRRTVPPFWVIRQAAAAHLLIVEENFWRLSIGPPRAVFIKDIEQHEFSTSTRSRFLGKGKPAPVSVLETQLTRFAD
jgi:hypothetical protein